MMRLSLLAMALVLFSCSGKKADKVYFNGNIWTGDVSNPVTWVMEGSWDHENWGGELPSKEWIDSVTGDHPLFISRYDGHMAFANSKAMSLAGINAATQSPEGGVVGKNAKGEPTGIFKDAAMNLINQVIPAPTEKQLDDYFDAAAKHAVERGVTNTNDMNSYGGWADLETYRRAAGTDRMVLRMYSFGWIAGLNYCMVPSALSG